MCPDLDPLENSWDMIRIKKTRGPTSSQFPGTEKTIAPKVVKFIAARHQMSDKRHKNDFMRYAEIFIWYLTFQLYIRQSKTYRPIRFLKFVAVGIAKHAVCIKCLCRYANSTLCFTNVT